MAARVNADTVDRLRSVLIRIARRIDRQVSAGGLSSTQLSVLASVAAQGPLGLSELADIEGINPTMLSRIVGKLEEAGFVQREVDQVDRRVVRVVATPAGAAVRQRLLEERSKLLAERLADLPDNVVHDIVSLLPALEALSVSLGSSLAMVRERAAQVAHEAAALQEAREAKAAQEAKAPRPARSTPAAAQK